MGQHLSPERCQAPESVISTPCLLAMLSSVYCEISQVAPHELCIIEKIWTAALPPIIRLEICGYACHERRGPTRTVASPYAVEVLTVGCEFEFGAIGREVALPPVIRQRAYTYGPGIYSRKVHVVVLPVVSSVLVPCR